MQVVRNNADQTFSFSFDDTEKFNWTNCEAFIEDLKVSIPSDQRKYDSKNQEWTIDEAYLQDFQGLREKHFETDGQKSLF